MGQRSVTAKKGVDGGELTSAWVTVAVELLER